MHSLSLAQILLTASVATLAGALTVLIGVWGVEKHQNRRLTELELDIEQTRSSQKSFQKTVSGKMGQNELQAKRSIEEQAREHLKGNNVDSDEAWLTGKS